jgi:RNA polymerase sigma factor (sigma-70 family)
MNSMETGISIDALLAERAWLRRLASALTRDREAADDLTQEAWVTALTSPPRSATRAWLKRVLLSRLYDDHRSRERRQQREQTVHDLAAAQVATPEDLTLRMELHRRLAEHIAALDEDLRQILFLRYVEDLEPVEMARRLGIPDGTIRWRLKRGLDELRARLDAEAGGDRRRWRAVLAPLASPLAVRRKPVFSRTTHIAAAFALLTVALSLAQWRCSTSRLDDTGLTEEGSSGDPANAPPLAEALASSLGASDAQAAVEPPPPCPEAEALEKERDQLAKLTEKFRTVPRDLFLKLAPNTVLDPQFVAAVDEMIEKPGKCSHTFECRGVACRLSLMVPESITKVKGWSPYECVDGAQWERVATRILAGPDFEYGGSTFDPVARAGFKKVDVYVRIANEQGVAGTPEEHKPVRLPPGWERDRGPVPARLAPACRGRVLHVRKEIADLVRQINRTMHPHIVFEQSTPRPALARELAGILRPYLAASGDPLPVEIECRGTICALRPREDVAGSAVSWHCQASGKPGGICYGKWNDDGWFARLVNNYPELPLDGLLGPWRFGDDARPAFAILRPGGLQPGVPWNWWALTLTRSLDYAGIVAACERRHPTKGFLTVMAKVAETCGPAEKPTEPPITMQYGGELMGSELAECLRIATDQALARLEPPACTRSWLQEWRLEFPDPKIDLTSCSDE